MPHVSPLNSINIRSTNHFNQILLGQHGFDLNLSFNLIKLALLVAQYWVAVPSSLLARHKLALYTKKKQFYVPKVFAFSKMLSKFEDVSFSVSIFQQLGGHHTASNSQTSAKVFHLFPFLAKQTQDFLYLSSRPDLVALFHRMTFA